MNFLKQKRKIFFLTGIVVAVFVVFYTIYQVVASQNTNVDTVKYKYAWSENGGWLNFGSSNGEVMITNSELTGYVWSENLGWISLNCSNNNSCATVNFGVKNDGSGNLSGYAWGENIGWINFSPSNGGVYIDTSGNFSGYAWGENIGWIIFNCQDVDACSSSDFKVKTTWLPVSTKKESSNDDSKNVEISNVHYSSTDTTISIKWTTNHNADSYVRWGSNKNLKKEKKEDKKERKHKITLKNLQPNTKYFFRIKSTDGKDKSDSSRIHSALTKPVSAIFAKRQWESFDKNKQNEKKLEKVKIDVTDKSQTEIEKDEQSEQDELNKQDKKPKETAKLKNSENQKPSMATNFFSLVKNKISNSFAYVYQKMLLSQRKTAGLFNRTGEKITSTYNFAISKFSQKKTMKIAKLNQDKFFTTQIFNKNQKKLLAEVKFQIVDKSDKPIPHLQTMLFSEPQSSVTDDNGIVSFKDVPIGLHTLAFEYQGENFHKKIAIADTLTEKGNVREEIVQIKAQKEKIAVWMWIIIIMSGVIFLVAIYFGMKYYQIKKIKK